MIPVAGGNVGKIMLTIHILFTCPKSLQTEELYLFWILRITALKQITSGCKKKLEPPKVGGGVGVVIGQWISLWYERPGFNSTL